MNQQFILNHSLQTLHFILACNKKEEISVDENEESKKPDTKEKVNQPIIGGFLGMILFEPNFLNTNQSNNPNKG